MTRELAETIRAEVLRRANGRCEYSLYPEARSAFGHQIDHIVSRKHGGTSALDNLAFCCIFCNRYKGSDVAAIDSRTGEPVRLFHPRLVGGRITFALWAGSSNRLHRRLQSQHACCDLMKLSESWNVGFFRV